MIKQLNPPLPLKTPRGEGLAHFVIDYGAEAELLWVVFLDGTGECWTYPNPQIRAIKNITQGREHISPFYNPDDVKITLSNQHILPEHLDHYCHKDNWFCSRCIGSKLFYYSELGGAGNYVSECPFCGEK